jgi:hypothetical protein
MAGADDLAEAERRVAEDAARVSKQRLRISQLAALGMDTALPKLVLHNLIDSLALLERQRDRVARGMERSEGT